MPSHLQEKEQYHGRMDGQRHEKILYGPTEG